MKLTIATDGACLGNPGPGGWAFVVQNELGEYIHEASGSSQFHTTNNRSELMAVIQALEWFDLYNPGEWFDLYNPGDWTCLIQSDSQYVIKGITEWIYGWKEKGWKNSAKKPVKNEDLWRRLDAIAEIVKPEWEWVRGHNGHVLNERADKLANEKAGIR